MQEPKVYIVIVNYNGEKFQNDCVKSLKNISYSNFSIVVVDNNSQDNSINLLKEVYPDVEVILNNENYGVAKGNNIGIQYALENNAEYVLLLNNDTEVDKEFLSILVKNANENIITTSKIYYHKPNNVIWSAGGKINWFKGTVQHYGIDEIDAGQYNQSRIVEYSPTCCLLIHKSIFSKVGFMDENYFLYYDDTDFCVRANNSNFKILYCYDSIIWHKVSSSTGGGESNLSIYYTNRNRLYFIKKFKRKTIFAVSFFYASRFMKMLKYLLLNDRKRFNIILMSIKDSINNLMGKKVFN